MKVKSYLKTVERKSKGRVAPLGGFSDLNCSGGAGNFGAPKRVLEFIKKHNWASILWPPGHVGDVTVPYESLRQEIRNF